MILDLHTHTMYSYDAEDEPVYAHVASAVEKNIDVLGFTEHVDFFRRESLQESEFAVGTVDFEGYQAEIAPFRSGRAIMPDLSTQQEDIFACREKFSGRIKLRAGVEMGQPHAAPELADDLQKTYHFDYVIGSIHQLSSDMDMYFLRYETIHPDDFWKEYFGEMQNMLQYGKFQILGHIDYPLRVMKLPNNRPSLKGYMDYVEGILKEIICRGIALESNTKGLFGWQKQIGPEDFILKRYRELGGELITVGSDSHAPQTIGRGIPEALERLQQAGFRYITDFENGTAIQHTL
ncbi:MAG: histidinol-phosphatase HisJ family protein [Clostridia bacterium]|nr:histidinol-phosphatase HisJ family protein [Clostridia bacterium]